MLPLNEAIKKRGLKLKTQADAQAELERAVRRALYFLTNHFPERKRNIKKCLLRAGRLIIITSNKSLANELFLHKSALTAQLTKKFAVREVVVR